MPWKISLRRCFRIGEVRGLNHGDREARSFTEYLSSVVYRFLAFLREPLFEPRRHKDTKLHKVFSLPSLRETPDTNYTIGCVKKMFSIDLIIF